MLPKGDENYLATIHFQGFQLAVSVREGSQISTGRYGITVPMDLFTPLGGTRNGSKVGSNNTETPPNFVWFVFLCGCIFWGMHEHLSYIRFFFSRGHLSGFHMRSGVCFLLLFFCASKHT